MANMYKLNTWNENEKYFPRKIAQDVLNNNPISASSVKTSCCIDTIKIASAHIASIQTSCCIDTTKE